MTNSADYNRQRRLRLKGQGLCPSCGRTKPEANHQYCRHCGERARQSARRYLQGRGVDYQKKYNARLVSAGRCLQCRAKHKNLSIKYCDSCREKKRQRDHQRYLKGMAGHQQLKREVFAAYGGARCVCCGEKYMEFLTLDHILGGGNQHRRSLEGTRTGPHFYRKLKAAGFPNNPPLQVMCLNCNWAKGHYGRCPHEIPGSKRSASL